MKHTLVLVLTDSVGKRVVGKISWIDWEVGKSSKILFPCKTCEIEIRKGRFQVQKTVDFCNNSAFSTTTNLETVFITMWNASPASSTDLNSISVTIFSIFSFYFWEIYSIQKTFSRYLERSDSAYAKNAPTHLKCGISLVFMKWGHFKLDQCVHRY